MRHYVCVLVSILVLLLHQNHNDERKHGCGDIDEVSKQNGKLVTFGEHAPRSPVVRVIKQIVILSVNQSSQGKVKVGFQEEQDQHGSVSLFKSK